MRERPQARVTIKWVPGHQGLEGNTRANELARGTDPPGPSTPWPATYDPYEHRKALHTARRCILKELRANITLLKSPSQAFSRKDATIIRRAQTNTLITEHRKHYISGEPHTPACTNCGLYPDNKHQLPERCSRNKDYTRRPTRNT